jgi:hypothetical protein
MSARPEMPDHRCPGREPARAPSPPTCTGRRTGLLAVLLVCLALGGCRRTEELPTAYGQRRGKAAASVNGTSVLAGLFGEAGFRVTSYSYLSANLQRCDVIVWAPDDFGVPDKETREFFEQWFASKERKTLVYIGRDYDAALAYWDDVLPSAPPADRLELMRRRAEAAADYDVRRLDMPEQATPEWFTVRRDRPRRQATKLKGPWSVGINAQKADIRVRGTLDIPTDEELQSLWGDTEPNAYHQPDFTSLLHDGSTSLVTRVTKPIWGEGQLLVVTNGSFLLNLPLVNHEHRQLAGYLVQACEPGTRVAFLESGPGGPKTVNWTSSETTRKSRERVLLAVHWCVLGLAYCFCIFPIFGRPKALPDTQPSDFLQHVDALGELLKRSRDEHYARKQIEHYHAITRRDPNVRQGHPAPQVALPRPPDLAQEPALAPDKQP